MSYIGNTSDVEQEKNISDFRHNRSSTNLVAKNMGTAKISDVLWNHKRDDDSDSEISDSGNFLAKGIYTHIVCARKLCNPPILNLKKIYSRSISVDAIA